MTELMMTITMTSKNFYAPEHFVENAYKQYICDNCNGDISKGRSYYSYFRVINEVPSVDRVHPECYSEYHDNRSIPK